VLTLFSGTWFSRRWHTVNTEQYPVLSHLSTMCGPVKWRQGSWIRGRAGRLQFLRICSIYLYAAGSAAGRDGRRVRSLTRVSIGCWWGAACRAPGPPMPELAAHHGQLVGSCLRTLPQWPRPRFLSFRLLLSFLPRAVCVSVLFLFPPLVLLIPVCQLPLVLRPSSERLSFLEICKP
jgi:hypothetical protein